MINRPLLYIFLFSFASCNPKKEIIIAEPQKEIKIAKTVPENCLNVTDKHFNNHQDTVYYGDQFFTGYRYALYSAGDTAALGSYFNGVEEGWHRSWYPNRKPAEERFFCAGWRRRDSK